MIHKIQKMLSQGEGISVEFKKCATELPKSIYETICSFLNRNGGSILLGVEDDGVISGILPSELQKIKNNLVTALNNPNRIFPTVYLGIDTIELDEKLLLHIYIPESSQVHQSNGRIYDRNEDGDFDITGNTELIATMYIRKQREYTENTIYPFAVQADLKDDLIDRVRKMAVNRRPHHPWENLNNQELLKSAGLYQRNMQTGQTGYTLACILLFGKDEAIVSALPHHRTDAILRRVNLNRYDDRDDIRCNLIESYDRLMAFAEKHLNDVFYLEDDTRISVRNKLFREIVANLLIHREYSSAYPARLIISKEGIITENGNKAHGSGIINIEDFSPYPKNPIIANVFKEIGWADELGSGIRNIKHYAKIYSSSVPVLIEGDVFKTEIVFQNQPGEKEINETPKSDGKKATVKSDGKKATVKKLQQKECILEFLSQNECGKSSDFAELLNLKSTRIKSILNEMITDGSILAEGNFRNRVYKIK